VLAPWLSPLSCCRGILRRLCKGTTRPAEGRQLARSLFTAAAPAPSAAAAIVWRRAPQPDAFTSCSHSIAHLTLRAALHPTAAVNVLEGLELHRGVLTGGEQARVVEAVEGWVEMVRRGRRRGRRHRRRCPARRDQ
jgi:hypothetical protein